MTMNFDRQFVLTFLEELLKTDSPSGFAGKAFELVERYARSLGFGFAVARSGLGMIDVAGQDGETVAVCAHVDTLGLMVRSIRDTGELSFTKVGGPTLATLDGEYCKIYTRKGNRVLTGTILSDYPSGHVHRESGTAAREEKNMHVRLDEKVKTKQDVLDLGVAPGDYVCFDTKTAVTDSGFIKSRFLDDKLSVAVLFGVLKFMVDNGLKPRHNVKVLLSSLEEVGHGMSYIPEGISELLAVDMGCIGEDLCCTEYDVSICAMDSSGPHDYELTNRLIALAEENKLQYAVDVYPSYSSDVAAARKAGHNIKGALIGPGVAASHGMERSHYEAVENAMALVALYLELAPKQAE